MKVLFVDPGEVSESWYSNRQAPNLGLAYIGTYLNHKGHTVKIVDMATYKSDVKSLKNIVREFEPDVVGVTAASFNILPAYDVLHAVKEVDTTIFTVIGGPHATAVPERTLKECSALDAAVVSEGERAMEKICTNPQPGIYQEPYIEPLDILPFPDWTLFDYSQYKKAYSLKFKEERHIYIIITSRGCPYQCKFCFPVHGRKVRSRSAENVFAEIQRDYQEYGATFFYVADSTLALNEKRIRTLCQLLIDSNLDISFKCQTRVNLVTEKVLTLLKKAGCELLFFGLESGNEEILKRCGKNITKDMIRTAVSRANEAGLCVRASFIIGLDGDTRDTIRETIEFARELKDYGLDQAQFHCLDLYPETAFWHIVEGGEGTLKRGFENKYDWSVFSRNTPSMTTGDLTIEEIKALREEGLDLFDKE